MAKSQIPLILDVDTGIDDALGLLYACAIPEVEILGVATVAGNVDLARATRNTRAVLALAGRPEIPVWPGCARAILGDPGDASAVHGDTGLGHAVLPEPASAHNHPHAIDAIVAAANARPGEVTLAATGPLTNVAAALLREPALPRLLKKLVIMGGAFKEGGNVTPAAEFNIWRDPEAAHIVFASFGRGGAAPLVAVGLDVTRRTRLLPEDLARLARDCEDAPGAQPLVRFLEDSTRHYFEFIEKREKRRFFTMHDPLAVAAAIDPSLIDTALVAVDVETSGALTRGMTVADWTNVWRREPNAEVAIGVRAERMIEQFLAAMERLARARRADAR